MKYVNIKKKVISLIFFFSTRLIFPEEANHNRIAVIDKNIFQSQVGIEYNIPPYITGLKTSFFSLSPQGNLFYKHRWYLGLNFPIFFQIPLSITENKNIQIAPGNLQIDIARITQTNQGRFQLDISSIFPTGYNAEYAFTHKTVQTSDGLYYIGVTGLYTYFSDPVSIDFALTTTTSFPITINKHIFWKPLDLQTTIGMNTVLNREIAFRLDLKDGMTMPSRLDNKWIEENILLSTIGSLCVFYNKSTYSFSMRFIKNFTDPLSGLNIRINYSYILN